MIAFAGIDGTGPLSNAAYAADFANSHIKRLYNNWPYPDLRFYSRGPSALGMETGVLAQKVHMFVKEAFDSGKAKAIFLAGYSRGGAAVIEAASYLHGFVWNTDVDCLILFDAVDRSTEVGGLIFDTRIRGNVKNCFHAMRDPAAGSRESFGNCGTKVTSHQTLHVVERFNCTHGAIGGTPWTGGKDDDLIKESFPDGKTNVTYKQDALVANEVWKWMNRWVTAAMKSTIAGLG
jgi:hypothetical protein